MTAADRREELEAAIWRHWPVHRADVGKSHAPRIEAILATADAYAAACVAQALDTREHTARAVSAAIVADRQREIAEGRERLLIATAEYNGRTP